MDHLFYREEDVIRQAEEILSGDTASKKIDADQYRLLLSEYKSLMRQMRRIVRMSDKTQLELKTLSEKLDQLSVVDSLTGYYNRRYFNEIYVKEWANSIRNRQEIAVIMADIDYFKQYNDTYGHLQGDECIRKIADRIAASVCRPRDIMARFGGEEFVVLLPETGIEGAVTIAATIIEKVRQSGIEHKSSAVADTVTVSLGIASAIAGEDQPKEELINNSDLALYQAKNQGRNRYAVFDAKTPMQS